MTKWTQQMPLLMQVGDITKLSDKEVAQIEKYIEQGYISHGDYENLVDYLYAPYHKMGGNGTAERIVGEVKKLPLRKDPYEKEE